MTENQETQIINLLTKAVNGVQRLEEGVQRVEDEVKEIKIDVAELKTDVAELKTDVAELKGGQVRMEKHMEVIGRALNSLAGDNIKVKARVEILEDLVN